MTTSLQDILRRRQQEEFVGREEQLAFFRRNLRYAPDDDRRRFIISISGQGGVGKTWLLRRFRKIVEEVGAVTACTDETEGDVPSVMGRIAEQFDAQEHSLKTFAERYRVYRQRREEIEADPEAPQGFPAFLGRTLAKGGLRLARRVPVGGVVADFVDEEAFASLAGDFSTYVARKIRNKDEVRLVLEPVEVLTPLFLADLREVGEKHTIALFCDTYERTGDFLDSWLRDLLEGRHGDVPANILLTIAGRDELDHNHWAPYEGLLARLPLETFTEEEARDYLARKGIANERVEEVILHLSRRLPLLVATLAAESPDDPAEVGDPSGEAVERFLKWVEDPKQRQVALDAAVPRLLNRDVLAMLVGEEEANALFGWLRDMPFVEMRGDGWTYHDAVRMQMLHYKRQESPQGWADLHGRLAAHYESLGDDLGLEEEAGHKDETWQECALAALYHRLCRAPQTQMAGALDGFVAALDAPHAFADRWAEVIGDAGQDAQVPHVQEWGRRLVEGMKAYAEDRYQEAAEMFTALLEQADLDTRWHAVTLASRGETYRLIGRYENSLVDFDRATELNSNYAWAIARRGVAYGQMRRYEEALADFNCAIELNPDDAWAIASRGETCRRMKRYDDALADFNRAIELNSDYIWAISSRGVTYRQIGSYDKALADLHRAIESNPDYTEAIASRGETYRRMGCYDEALADFDRAIELNPDYAEAIASRGVTYGQVGCYDEALADFTRVIELKPNYTWAIASRGEAYRRMGLYDDARVDFDRAIELKPSYTWAIASRGVTYLLMGRYEEALTDFGRAIELGPENDWYFYNRALVYRVMGRTSEARTDVTVAIQFARQRYEQSPQDKLNIFNLALYYLAAGEAERAERLYRQVLSDGASPYLIRGAILTLEIFLKVLPNHPQAQVMRDLLQQHLQEADQ
jgi:tetratricopeptide (TPR) repeat protein